MPCGPTRRRNRSPPRRPSCWRANALVEGRARITLTPGPADGGGPCTTLITADPLPVQPAEWYQRGVGVVVSSYKQGRDDPLAGYKTGCYLPRLLARQEAAAKGAEEALWFTTDNLLAEACFCNVFCVLGGRVLTPPLDTPVLPGIVRGAVAGAVPGRRASIATTAGR